MFIEVKGEKVNEDEIGNVCLYFTHCRPHTPLNPYNIYQNRKIICAQS